MHAPCLTLDFSPTALQPNRTLRQSLAHDLAKQTVALGTPLRNRKEHVAIHSLILLSGGFKGDPGTLPGSFPCSQTAAQTWSAYPCFLSDCFGCWIRPNWFGHCPPEVARGKWPGECRHHGGKSSIDTTCGTKLLKLETTFVNQPV